MTNRSRKRKNEVLSSDNEIESSEADSTKFSFEDQMRDFKRLIEGTVRAVIETGGDLAESGNYEESQEFKSVLKELVGLKGGIEGERRLLQEFEAEKDYSVLERFKSFDYDRNLTRFDDLREYNEITWESGPGFGNRHAYPLLDDEQDSEGLTMQSRDSLKCPISQLTLSDPVKNPLCNHIYSREAIEQLMRRGSGASTSTVIPCPVAGCQKNVNKNALVCDDKIAGKLKRLEERIF